MDNTTQNMPPIGNMPVHEKKSYGALIAVVVILFLIVIGGLYFLGKRLSDNKNMISDTSAEDSTTSSLKTQSDSDEVSSIEADLNATDVDNIDQGAAALESEINAE